ncbi:hypothetical protein [Ammoniphilus resinae]|nr:hypothetical protein [Ammoniphilus resinae]
MKIDVGEVVLVIELHLLYEEQSLLPDRKGDCPQVTGSPYPHL